MAHVSAALFVVTNNSTREICAELQVREYFFCAESIKSEKIAAGKKGKGVSSGACSINYIRIGKCSGFEVDPKNIFFHRTGLSWNGTYNYTVSDDKNDMKGFIVEKN